MQSSPIVTRFAPSPSGYLHLGHALAAYEARARANQAGGKCLLRIEDIDHTRCREEYVTAIIEDMAWLGISFDGEIVRQSQRMALYETALQRLIDRDVVYPCFCTRKQIAQELERVHDAPQGETIDPYPLICRHLTPKERAEKINAGLPYCWRLNAERAADLVGTLTWYDHRFGVQTCYPERVGDVILARKDCATSYHLAVVTDDAAQGVNLISRGEDLFDSTHIHRILQELLGLPVPTWYHHRLIKDDQGIRLAKRNKSLSLREMKEQGHTPESIMALLKQSCADLSSM